MLHMANGIHCCLIIRDINDIHEDVMNSFLGWLVLVMLPQNHIHGMVKCYSHWQVEICLTKNDWPSNNSSMG